MESFDCLLGFNDAFSGPKTNVFASPSFRINLTPAYLILAHRDLCSFSGIPALPAYTQSLVSHN
jgi:hypothetical protein